MRTRMLVITGVLSIIGIGATGAVVAQKESPRVALTGHWEGRIDLGRSLPRIVLHATATPDPATVDMPDSGQLKLAVQQLSIEGDRIRFELQTSQATATFAGTIKDGAITGDFRQDNLAGSFFLVRTLEPDLASYRRLAGSYEIGPGRVIDVGPFRESGNRLTFVDSATRRTGVLYATTEFDFFAGATSALAYPVEIRATFVRASNGEVTGLRWRDGNGRTFEGKRIAPYREEEIVSRNGDVTMHSTLTLPKGPGPHPVVIFAPGSSTGPPRPAGFNPYFMVRHGFGLLTIDKRGTGASNGDWRTSTYEDLARDLIAAAEVLATRPDVDARRIGIWGNSEGGWTAPLAASLSNVISSVIIRSASALPITAAVAMEAETRFRDATDLSNEEIKAAVAFKQETEHIALTPEPWPDVWPRIVAKYDSMQDRRWLQYVRGPGKDHWWWQWWRLRGGYDPAPALEKLRIPVLVWIPDKDCCMPPAAANAAAFRNAFARGGNTRAEIHVVPGANHGLLEAKTGFMSEGARLNTYAPGYLDRIVAWLRVNAGPSR
jgi:pimeloyl-ACP methyl ester carboxylesterase